MTNPDYRHIEIIADRSGSMMGVAEETSKGIAEFITGQILPGYRTTVTLTQFDTDHDQVYAFENAESVPVYTLEARGMTALHDAIGFAFTRAGERLAAMPEDERPGEVVVLIATDGGENASREYSQAQASAMITRQQEQYGWKVTYIGANQNAIQVGSSLGVPAAMTLNFNTAATAGTYAAASAMVSRGTQSGIFSYTQDERDAAVSGTATSSTSGCSSSQPKN
jgi:hypothetical protein